jgi:hypothetical protein
MISSWLPTESFAHGCYVACNCSFKSALSVQHCNDMKAQTHARTAMHLRNAAFCLEPCITYATALNRQLLSAGILRRTTHALPSSIGMHCALGFTRAQGAAAAVRHRRLNTKSTAMKRALAVQLSLASAWPLKVAGECQGWHAESCAPISHISKSIDEVSATYFVKALSSVWSSSRLFGMLNGMGYHASLATQHHGAQLVVVCSSSTQCTLIIDNSTNPALAHVQA